MSVIIRLQNLPWSANALDIRQFFQGLSIPEGGVHIVGGELGDAFIAFSTDEDARQAFGRNGGKIKEIQIQLMLSSRTEMQRVIEAARTQSFAAFAQPAATPQPAQAPLPAAIPHISSVTESKKEEKESKKESSRRRSRSKSRDRKDRDRSRERSRRHRDRSRSRSRDRRERRRRDRSRTRSRDRDRSSKDRSSRERSSRDRSDRKSRDNKKDDRSYNSPPKNSTNTPQQNIPKIWAHQTSEGLVNPLTPLLNPAAINLLGLQAKINPLLAASQANAFRSNTFDSNNFNSNNERTNNWQQQRQQQQQSNNFQNNNGNKNLNSFTRSDFMNKDNRSDFMNKDSNRNMRENNRGTRDNGDDNNRQDNRNNNRMDNRRRDNMRNENMRNENLRNDNMRNDLYENRIARFSDNNTRLNDGFGARNGRFDESEPDEDSCVQLVPFYGGYSDVRRFFQGIFISNKGIKFINDEAGHRTGIVYIKFARRQGKNDALKKHNDILNGIKVEVSHLDNEEFEKALDRYVPNMEDDDTADVEIIEPESRFKYKNISKTFIKPEPEIKNFQCITVNDLPSYVKEQDILHMFSSHPLFSLILTNKPKGGSIAYVKFSNVEVAKKAFEEKHTHVIHGKQVTVKPCTDVEFDVVNKVHDLNMVGSRKQQELETDCLDLTKLPPKTNDRDILDFFSDIGVIPKNIHLMNNDLGFTGQAYCEFENTAEAVKALKKDETILGNVKVSVKPIDRKEMESILGSLGKAEPMNLDGPLPKIINELPIHDIRKIPIKDMHKGPISDMGPVSDMGSISDMGPMRDVGPMRNMDPMNDMDMLGLMDVDMNHPMQMRGPRGPQNRLPAGFNQRGGDFSSDMNFPSRGGPGGDFNSDMNFQSRGDGPAGLMSRQFLNRTGFDGPRGPQRFGPRGAPGGPRQRFNGPPIHPTTTEGLDEAPPGCTVYMDNVPYKAGTNEILEFFNGYDITNNVSRRYNPNNTPSGEARVVFNSAAEAFRAVREKKGHNIWDRTIFLKQQ